MAQSRSPKKKSYARIICKKCNLDHGTEHPEFCDVYQAEVLVSFAYHSRKKASAIRYYQALRQRALGDDQCAHEFFEEAKALKEQGR